MPHKASEWFLGLARLFLGWTFFWAFIDKLFGLGFATADGKSWLDGVSPTYGFLSKAAHGPFANIFKNLADSDVVAWLFMLGLLLIGVALLLGIGVRVAGYAGALLVVLMWLALLPPSNNPFMDDHLIYAAVLLAFANLPAGDWLGLGAWWKNTSLVQKYPCLQ